MSTIYDKIGGGYDVTRKADPFILSQLRCLLKIEPEGRYLDVACGTGNYTSEMSKYGGKWSAFDQSEVMLSEAAGKSQAVHWSKFDVEQTGYKSSSFDGAICSLAIHHFPNLFNAFREISRVLKPAGKLVLLTATPAQMQSYWLNEYFPHMMDKSCENMSSLTAINSSSKPHGLTIKGTTPLFITAELQDFFLYSGKLRPEMYLQESVRDGISSFRDICASEEVTSIQVR